MRRKQYRDSLIECYAVHLLQKITEAEIVERGVYLSRLDELLKYDGISRLVQMSYSPGSEQPLDDKPSEEIEYTVRL